MSVASPVSATVGQAIWKFELRTWSLFLDVPQGAQVLSAGAQGASIVAWVLCDPEAPKVSRLLAAMPTGSLVPRAYEAATFVGTVQMDDGLVFHVWDGGER